MASDANLIRAAFKYGETLAGATTPDTSAMSKGAVNVGRTFFGAAKDILKIHTKRKKKNRADRENQLKGFKTKLDSARRKLGNVNLDLPPKFQEALIDKFKELENEFDAVNTTGKKDTDENEKARARLEYRLDGIIAQQTDFRTMLATMADKGSNSINLDATEAVDLAIGEKIWDFDDYKDIEIGFTDQDKMFLSTTLRDYVKSGSGFTGEYDDDGVPIYSDWEMEPADYTEHWTMEEIQKRINFKNIDIDVMENDRYEDLSKKGEQTDDDWAAYENIERTHIISEVLQNDPSRFYDAGTRGVGGNIAWEDALSTNPNILIESLPKVPRENIDALNTDHNDVIDLNDIENLTYGEEIIWQHNLEQMVKTLVNPNSEFHDSALSTELLVDFLLDRRKQSFDAGRVIRNKKKNEVTSDLTYAQRLRLAQQKDLYPRVQEAIATGNYSNVNLLGGNKKVTPSSKDPNKLHVFEGTTVITTIDTTKPGWEQQIMNFFMEDPLYKYQIPKDSGFKGVPYRRGYEGESEIKGGGKILD